MATRRRRTSGRLLTALAVGLVITLAAACSSTSPGSDASAPTTSRATASADGAVEWLTTLPVNGVDQAVEVRGDDAGAPLLLVIHGGPGFAMIDLLHETMPELEDRFVTVNYDQRGAGLSYSPGVDPETITLDQLVDDADTIRQAVLDHLDAEPGRAVYVMGHSMGTMIGLDLVRTHPDRYAGFVGVGQVTDVVANEQGSYAFALAQATAEGNATATSQLTCVGPPLDDLSYAGCPARPGLDGFEVTACWTGNFGGEVWGATSDDPVVEAILDSPAYRDRTDRWWAGLELSQALFDDPAVLAWDAAAVARDLPVPVYVFQGHHDFDTPWPLAEALMPAISGPHRLLWFENSSHFPFFEEPDTFARALTELAAGALPADGSTGSAGPAEPEPSWGTPPQSCG